MSEMRNLLDIINEMSEEGFMELEDSFDFELNEETLIESGIIGFTDDGIIVECDETALQLLESNGLQLEEVEVDESGLQAYLGKKKYGEEGMKALQKAGREGASKETMAKIRAKHDKLDEVEMDESDLPMYGKAMPTWSKGEMVGGPARGSIKTHLGRPWRERNPLDRLDTFDYNIAHPEGPQKLLTDPWRQYDGSPESLGHWVDSKFDLRKHWYIPDIGDGKTGADSKLRGVPVTDKVKEEKTDEAKYQGREVPLGKPMAGDVKKSKVYVKGPKGNVVKVNFGDKKMRIKKSNPGRRKNFRARHNCDNPGPRWKARYWSCRAW